MLPIKGRDLESALARAWKRSCLLPGWLLRTAPFGATYYPLLALGRASICLR